jgi:hypothetical protein
VLAGTTLADAKAARHRFNQYVAWAAMPETTRLKKTIDTCWTKIETLIHTRATNTGTEAANLTINNIKRTGKGYPITSQLPVHDHGLQRRPQRVTNTRRHVESRKAPCPPPTRSAQRFGQPSSSLY